MFADPMLKAIGEDCTSPASMCSVAIIDDHASVIRAMGRLARAAGFAATGFDSAEGFLADPLRHSFACLLVDIDLGGMSGFDLQRHLQAEGSSVPLIFLTARDTPAHRAEATQVGCVGFFSKTDPGAIIIQALRGATSTDAA